jgi:lysozyme family protein
MAMFELAIPTILRHEGGYVNDKDDPGGATNWGVSLRWLQSQGEEIGDLDHDGDIDVQDIAKMTQEQACAIYQNSWWTRYGYSYLKAQAVATKVFDMAINMGAKQAHKLVQRAVNRYGSHQLFEDGVLGPMSMSCINDCNGDFLLNLIREEQATFYRNLARTKPKLSKFLRGWLKRAYE